MAIQPSAEMCSGFNSRMTALRGLATLSPTEPMKTNITLCLLLTIGVASLAQPTNRPQPPQARHAPALLEGTKVQRDIAYVPNSHPRQKLDLFLPPGETNPLPLIIWIHGGAWGAGSKEQCPALPYLPRGYAVASINYRLSQHAVFPAQIEDCKAAIRWLGCGRSARRHERLAHRTTLGRS
jgi:acetyl esterase/lipase